MGMNKLFQIVFLAVKLKLPHCEADFSYFCASLISRNMTKKVQDNDYIYSVLRPYVDLHARRAYRRFEVHGAKDLPKDGSMIFGVNHSNTMMDAMVMLATSHHKKVFMGRGDIFKNPYIAKILNFLRILPLFRIRNGVAAVRNNAEPLEKAVDVIHDRVGLYLFPEGQHRTKHSLLHLSKGIFHIALNANEQFGKDKPVYIVPTAIEYGDYFRFRTTALVNFGKAINVTEFINNSHEDNEAVLMNQLKEMLYKDISELFTFIPDDEDYDAIWEIVKMKNEKRAGGLYKKMLRNRMTVEKVLKFREEKPEEAKELFQRVNDFAKERVKNRISVMSTAKKYPLVNSLWKLLLIILGAPYFIASAAVNAVVWIPSLIIKGKLKDKAFSNTVTFGVRFVIFPIVVIAGTAVLFCLLPWYWALAGTALLFFSYDLFIDYLELLRRYISDVRWAFKKKLRRQYVSLNLNKLF